ncbi:1,4-dihydroxy-2-naphthoate polyprenyltransferase [Schumannella sp. 10F1B-5-1]|nr:1,4-dihydroxy-2-naphthoate polyprenyltransferase [Schumannella sp. 10F1B-5-1]TPW71810.1 1,4-dihydroxy-2-naphthoate polyprenyltransferase [Schumannella sp. 10F1B-5-1]
MSGTSPKAAATPKGSASTAKKGGATPKANGAVAKTRRGASGPASAAARAGRSEQQENRARANAGRSGRPGGRPVSVERPLRWTDWISAARPQTLALAIAPVALGTATAGLVAGGWTQHWVRAIACLVVALALQIGVNFANDYSDGIRGTDTVRQGPARLVGSGRAKPRTVLIVALVFFGIAAVAGVFLVVRSEQWWLLAVGAVCIVAAWFYTGGKRPYGYMALGEVAVFIFFGLVATAGTMFVQVGTVSFEAWMAGVAAGLFACAVLMVNNLRDREQDALAGKRTLSVLIGDLPSRIAFGVLLLAPFVINVFFLLLFDNALYVYFVLVAALPAVVITLTAKTAKELVLALRLSVLSSLAFGLALAAAIAF